MSGSGGWSQLIAPRRRPTIGVVIYGDFVGSPEGPVRTNAEMALVWVDEESDTEMIADLTVPATIADDPSEARLRIIGQMFGVEWGAGIDADQAEMWEGGLVAKIREDIRENL